MAVVEWAVEKITTDKLSSALNDMSEARRELEQITFVGGRDWILISFRELPPVSREIGNARSA